MHVISRCNAIFLTAAFLWPGHENIYCYCTNIQGYHQVCKICGHKCTYYCMTRNNALTVKVYKNKKKIYIYIYIQITQSLPSIANPVSQSFAGFIEVRQIFFFQGQGIVRKFCDMSGKMKFCKEIQGITHFSCIKLGCLVYLSC